MVEDAPDSGRAVEGRIAGLLELLCDPETGLNFGADALHEARQTARGLFEACGASPQAHPLVMLSCVAELLAGAAVDLAANRSRAQRLIEALEAQAGIPRVALGRELLR